MLTFFPHITVLSVPFGTPHDDSHQAYGALVMSVLWLIFSLFYMSLLHTMWNSRAMRQSPVNHTHTNTHACTCTHTHTHTTCIDCDINKQQEQRTDTNYAKVCAFVPIRIPYTANMMVNECVRSALTDIVTSMFIASL